MNTDVIEDGRYQQARTLLDAGRLAEAKRVYEEIISVPGDHRDAYLTLGAICSDLGEIGVAMAYTEKAIATDPGCIEAYLIKARLHYLQGNMALSEQALGEVMQLEPDSHEALSMLGSICLQKGEFEKAEDACLRLVNSYFDDITAWEMLARINTQRGNAHAAIGNYEQVLRLKPDHLDAHYSLGLILLNQINNPAAAEPHIRKAIELNPAVADAHVLLGFLLGQKGDYPGSEMCNRKAIDLQPGHYGALTNLGHALKEQGRFDEALEYYTRACNVRPDQPTSWVHLGAVYGVTMDHDRAIDCYRKALELKPGAARIAQPLSTLLRLTGKFNEAKFHCLAALDIEPEAAKHHVELGDIYLAKGSYDEAVSCYDHALALDVNNVSALVGKVNILNFRKEYTQAMDTLMPLLLAGSGDARVALAYASLSRQFDHYREAAGLIEKILEKGVSNMADRADLHFAIGRLYDDLGEYEKAFSHFKSGNDLRRSHFDPGRHHEFISALIQVYGAAALADLPHAVNTSRRPIFIVGMPRSGTSLVEQILASHPMVHGAGELDEINQIAFSLPALTPAKIRYPYCVPELTQETVDTLAGSYLSMLDQLSGGKSCVTDKMPTNYLHLGLIELLFPGARVIHCMRNPLDTCLSNYFRNFIGNIPFSYRLDHLGAYYREYARLMEHWRSILRIPFLEIEYESLVVSPERQSRKLIEFCGLDWDESCLRFYETPRITRTASYDQVRQPIYNKSMGRWKHYRRHLGPLAAALGIDITGESQTVG
jgi:tetratricopeptide (TPR) repeat protein